MINGIEWDKVAQIIAPIMKRGGHEDEDDGQLELNLKCEEADAERYYEMLQDVIEAMGCLKDIIMQQPVDVMEAADAGIVVTYSDKVIKGKITIKGGVDAGEGSV